MHILLFCRPFRKIDCANIFLSAIGNKSSIKYVTCTENLKIVLILMKIIIIIVVVEIFRSLVGFVPRTIPYHICILCNPSP